MAARAARSGSGLAHHRAQALGRPLHQSAANFRFADSQAMTNDTIRGEDVGGSHVIKNSSQVAMAGFM
jgi:hypothetical protein